MRLMNEFINRIIRNELNELINRRFVSFRSVFIYRSPTRMINIKSNGIELLSLSLSLFRNILDIYRKFMWKTRIY